MCCLYTIQNLLQEISSKLPNVQILDASFSVTSKLNLIKLHSFKFLALLDYVSRAHKIKIRPSSVDIVFSKTVKWIDTKFW